MAYKLESQSQARYFCLCDGVPIGQMQTMKRLRYLPYVRNSLWREVKQVTIFSGGLRNKRDKELSQVNAEFGGQEIVTPTLDLPDKHFSRRLS